MTTPRKPPKKKQPAYLEIADLLKAQIDKGVLKPGDRLPTERELVEDFGVARMTVRHALDILQLEGLIDRKRGRTGGTFVRVIPPLVELTRMEGFSPQLRARGQQVESRILSAEVREAKKDVAKALQLNAGDKVYNIVRLRRVENIPLLIENSWFPHDLLTGLLDHDLSNSLYELLGTYERRPVRKRETVSPSVANSKEQELLKISRSLPLLRIQRIAEDAGGTPVEYSEDTLRSDIARVLVVTDEEHGQTSR